MQMLVGESPMEKKIYDLVKNNNGQGFCKSVCENALKDIFPLEFELLSFTLQWGNQILQNLISQVEI